MRAALTANLLLILLSAVTRSNQEYFHLRFHWNMDIVLRMLWLIFLLKVFRYTRNLCIFYMSFAEKIPSQKQTPICKELRSPTQKESFILVTAHPVPEAGLGSSGRARGPWTALTSTCSRRPKAAELGNMAQTERCVFL